MLISFNSICVKYQRFSLLFQIQMMIFRLDALKFENLYKKLLPTISTFSYVSGQTKQACPTVQPIRHTRHNCSFTIRAWTAISKTGLKRSNLNFNSIRHWYQSLLHLSTYIILTYLSNCKRFQLKLVPIFTLHFTGFVSWCILFDLHDSDEVGAFGFLEFHFDIVDGLFEVWDSRILQSVHSTAGFLDFICHELAAFFDFR